MLGSSARVAGDLNAFVWLPLLATACGPGTAESSPPPRGPTHETAATRGTPDAAEAEGRSPWVACYADFAPAGDASRDLARLVHDCGPVGGMHPVTAVRTGQQSEDGPVDRYTFDVTDSTRCYRIYAAGDSSVADLDVLVRGPTGAGAFADLTHDAWPVVPPREPACFSVPGSYMLEVSVYRGSGHYALQVWGR